ncbi:MAG: hypothetical protein ACK5Y2_00965, partial [Bdellovibrionales bacterium]
IEDMKQEISEEQELINKELADKQAEELRQLRKERNSAYRDIRDNKEKISNVLQKKNINVQELMDKYNEALDTLARVDPSDKKELSKAKQRANIVMQSVGEKHFISQTKENMMTKLKSQQIKSKLDELIRQIRQEGESEPEMKGEPGLIPFGGGSSSMMQIRAGT